MGVDSSYGSPAPKKPAPRKILRRKPGQNGGGVFAQPDYHATKIATGNLVNTQYQFGLLRMFGIGYNQGPLVKEGNRTLSGAEADRRWSQQAHLLGAPGWNVAMGLAQSRTGGVRYIEPTMVRNAPIHNDIWKIDSTILKGKSNSRNKRKNKR